MINPLDSVHRQRLSRAVDHSFTELKHFGRMRSNTIQAYLGLSPDTPDWEWSSRKYRDSLPKGNLLQQAGLSMQIALAYGEPEFLHTPRVPEHAGTADKLQTATNRMAKLLDLGETARMVAADSFFGYGIFKTGIGYLPPAAQVATGVEVGPCVWRVSQDDFLYDITASSWDSVAYAGDLYTMPLDDAQRLYPHRADDLAQMTDVDRLDSPHVLPKPSRFHSPELELWLADIYFPAAKLVATWPVRNESFGSLADEPLRVMDYKGHWSGIYQILNHLYSPDELVPIAQAESVKALHFLFNDLLHLTSEQARNAKVNPTYQAGSERDMRRLWDAADRHPVSVVNPQNFSQFEIPGPSQSQTAYMSALFQFFKEFNPILDEPQRAPTATQGALVRQTTNAIIAEGRRKFNRALQMVGYKLGHMLMTDNTITLPSSRPVRPGSDVMVDTTWQPLSIEPRVAKVDDFDVNIEPYSTLYRTPEERLNQLVAATQQITGLMQLKAQGAPINVEEAIKDFSELSGLPRLKNWYEEADPLQQAKRQESRASTPRLGVGEYVRHNVSEKTNAGALEANLNQAGDENGQPRVE